MGKTQKCRKCKKPYQIEVSKSDLCLNCVKTFPYFLSFIEEGFVGVNDMTFGRVEVYSEKSSSPYAIDELRFNFKDNPESAKAFYLFRDKWDFKNVSQKELENVKKVIRSKFYKPVE